MLNSSKLGFWGQKELDLNLILPFTHCHLKCWESYLSSLGLNFLDYKVG